VRKRPRASTHEEALLLRVLPPIPVDATPLQRWRFRRNLVIYFLHKQGLTQRFIGDVFDMPHSTIGLVIREMAVFEASQSNRDNP
jgi:hypothetical protein